MKKRLETFFTDSIDSDSEGFPIITLDENESDVIINEDEVLSILPLRNIVLFPGVLTPVSVARPKSLRLIRKIQEKSGLIGAFTQIDKSTEDPNFSHLYPLGVVATIVRVIEMSDSSTTVILEGQKRVKLKEKVTTKPYLGAKVTTLENTFPKKSDKSFVALISSIRETAVKIVENSGLIHPELGFAIRNIENPYFLINYISANIGLEVSERQKLIEKDDMAERAYDLLNYLNKESQLLEIKNSIQNKVKKGIDQQQREYFLHQQMKTIQNELGENSVEQEIDELKKKAKNKKWSKEVEAQFEKELTKLERMNPHSPDYPIQLNYVEILLDLPWNEYTKDNFNLKNAEKVLNKDHFGLEKVKQRILEHLAVLKLKGDMKSPIICLYGPPGVGKTSLGKSIAESLKRKYVRMSLGGVHDEAEIRGHRKTYIGAMPGRIIQNLKKVKSSNPVFVLDEVDKVNSDYKGDPSSALLEVLDPEQNGTFHDNFLDIDYDLSKVLFVATANNINTIPRPLLDRMELIEVSGYTIEEKVEIATKHLIKKELQNHGLDRSQFKLKKNILKQLIQEYTRESGVRELDRKIAGLMRKVALNVATETEYNATLTSEDLKKYLGTAQYTAEQYEGNKYAGVVTGLAWTSVGGDILYIESNISKSKNPTLTITGNLGNVMKESAILALQYIKAHIEKLNIDQKLIDENSVHIHVPEGAIPKDGPSAGITIVTALVSTFTRRKVRKNIAMTGEITLRGKVLPVGGIKEKILAAKRAGINTIILSEENRKNIEEIEQHYLKGLKFHYVSDIMEVLDVALLKEKVEALN
ncbi:MAG: endopeptidase La [Paludibacter sp.]|nr:MAG: endopeptidase La [Paludibacter sp.]